MHERRFDLFVIIEAKGKKERLRNVLGELGYSAEVFATKGSLAGFPDDLSRAGIDAEFRGVGRQVRSEAHAWAARKIREKAALANETLVATDADSEGDAIAWDVRDLLYRDGIEPKRLRLKAIEPDAIKDALTRVGPVRKRDAVPGRTREIIDRAIGSTFSGNGVGVGRVSTALLGAIAQNKPAVERLRLVAPAADGGRPFVAETDVKDPLDHATAEKLAKVKLPALGAVSSREVNGTAANDMGRAMVSAGRNLNIGPKQAATAMQTAYEAGRLSYPRSGSGAMSKGAQDRLAKALQAVDEKFTPGNVPTPGGETVHEAPHPMTPVDPRSDPTMMDSEEGVRVQITRDLVKSGMNRRIDKADAQRLRKALTDHFPPKIVEHVVNLDWRREEGPKAPGDHGRPKQRVERKRNDTVALKVMLDNGIGRPSTWANHVETLMERNLLDEDMNLTRKGQVWLKAAPASLRDPRTSAAIERVCENPPQAVVDLADNPGPGKEPWEAYAQKIAEALPEDIKKPVMANLETPSSQPNYNDWPLNEPATEPKPNQHDPDLVQELNDG